jgi:ABC-type nitrate/sulfonate/bicarbonate transport system substrate-binding protein
MRPALDLGFVALVDAAPLIVAKARGEFDAEGLDVSLHREVSWATIRDKVAAGVHQGAHMLAPLAIATSMGIGSEPAALIAPMALNAHGASLGVSASLAAEMVETTAQGLARAVAARREAGRPAISFAVVFPYAMHNYMLRFWAASAGVDPDRDIRITVAAPTAIAQRLKSGEIDGFCVGAPWGALCEADSGARIVLEASEFWAGAPDKVQALAAPWAAREPQAATALTRAIMRAAMWADHPGNAGELAALLARREWLDAPQALIARGLGQIRFARHASLFPWRSQAMWIASQMLRWGQLDAATDLGQAAACYRPDMFRDIARDARLDAPKADSKMEGAHAETWSLPGAKGPIAMAPDLILGGAPFDPSDARAYAASFAITRAGA